MKNYEKKKREKEKKNGNVKGGARSVKVVLLPSLEYKNGEKFNLDANSKKENSFEKSDCLFPRCEFA